MKFQAKIKAKLTNLVVAKYIVERIRYGLGYAQIGQKRSLILFFKIGLHLGQSLKKS